MPTIEKCGHTHIAYNSCRNCHCPKCQGAAAKDWLAARQAELLPVEYYHLVFTLPAAIADIADQNKAAVYGILFKAAAETLIAIAADPSGPRQPNCTPTTVPQAAKEPLCRSTLRRASPVPLLAT